MILCDIHVVGEKPRPRMWAIVRDDVENSSEEQIDLLDHLRHGFLGILDAIEVFLMRSPEAETWALEELQLLLFGSKRGLFRQTLLKPLIPSQEIKKRFSV